MEVICGIYPNVGVRLVLSSPLPDSGGFTSNRADSFETFDGLTCDFISGTSYVVQGVRANYSCGNRYFGIGSPQSGKIWTIRIVELLNDAPEPQRGLDRIAELKTVWR
jgi:hypothetical protein